jgi:hypothetical protein
VTKTGKRNIGARRSMESIVSVSSQADWTSLTVNWLYLCGFRRQFDRTLRADSIALPPRHSDGNRIAFGDRRGQRRALLRRRPPRYRGSASDRFRPCDDRCRKRPSDELRVVRGNHGRAVFRHHAPRSSDAPRSEQRRLRAVERARGADPLRGMGCRGRALSRRTAHASTDRFAARGTPHSAVSICRRRNGLTRPGSVRRDRTRLGRALAR